MKVIVERRKVGWLRAAVVYIGQTRERRRLRRAADRAADKARERVSRMTPQERDKLLQHAREIIKGGK